MRVRPTERGLQHPVDNIEGQIRANLQPTPDRWFRVPEIDPHHEALQLWERGSAQLGASRSWLFSRSDTEARQSAGELSKVIELSSADDRVELAQQVSLAVVLAHARTVPPNARPTAATRPIVICGDVRGRERPSRSTSRRSVEFGRSSRCCPTGASLSAPPARPARRTRGVPRHRRDPLGRRCRRATAG